MQKNQMENAKTMFNARKATLPECEQLECLGNFFFYEHNKQEAIDKFEAAMTKNPDYDCARYHYLVGVQAEMQGDNLEAYDRYNAAIQIEPYFLDSYLELGGVLVKADDLDLAARVYEDALALDPCDLRMYANLKTVYEALYNRRGDDFKQKFTEALENYDKASKRLPAIPEQFKW